MYFGVHAKDLQPHQAALLAALIQNPTANDPLLHPRSRPERRNLVLGKLLEQGYIDTFEYQLADSKPLLPRGRPIGFPAEKKTIANYFVDYVRQQLINLYGRQRALGGGLRVYTTLNPRMQRLALKAVRATLPKRRPEAALVAINPPTGEVRAMVGGRDYTNTVYGKFNLATDAVRQPGSAFKIFVLIAALEEGILPQTQFNSHRLLLDLPGRARVVGHERRGRLPRQHPADDRDDVLGQHRLRPAGAAHRHRADPPRRARDGHRAAGRRRPGDRARRPAPLLHADRDGARATRRSRTAACA